MLDPQGDGAVALVPLALTGSADGVSEAAIQALVQAHPSCLPIAEIDPLFAGPVPICIELTTPAGPIDNFMVTPSGLPVLVECKLWRNPEGRREVVGQILDYAKELSRWSSSDLQREVSRRLKRDGNPLLDLVREAGHDVDEIAFNDALTLNLRRGRFLLLIVGDGIREGVEAIAEYLQAHAGLHFTLGLVEMPIYVAPSGERLVVPRVLARTENIVRTVIETPSGYAVQEQVEDSQEVALPGSRSRDPVALAMQGNEKQQFWDQFLEKLSLDDPEQAVPRAARGSHIVFKFPAPGGSSWLSVYRSVKGELGLFLSGNENSPGHAAAQMLEAHKQEIQRELGSEAMVEFGDTWPHINDHIEFDEWNDPVAREQAFVWLRSRTNDFVNALRPRIRAALADLGV